MAITINSAGLIFGVPIADYIPKDIKIIENYDTYVLINKKTGEIATYSRETGRRLDSIREDSSPCFIFKYSVSCALDFFKIINKCYLPTNQGGRRLCLKFSGIKSDEFVEIIEVKECQLNDYQNFCTLVVSEVRKNSDIVTIGSWFFNFNDTREIDYEILID